MYDYFFSNPLPRFCDLDSSVFDPASAADDHHAVNLNTNPDETSLHKDLSFSATGWDHLDVKLSRPYMDMAKVATGPLQTWGATVTEVLDGDTFDVVWDAGDEPPEGVQNRIRLAGVDTNEISHDGGITPAESFSVAAWNRLAELIPVGTHVTLEARDMNSLGMNNRPLRHVFVGTTNVAEVLVREGLGLAASYDMEPDYRDDYFHASETAQINHNGMWAPGASGGDPSTWPDINVVVNYDAAGNDDDHLNDEYIQIRNEGNVSLDISNWTARSSARLDGSNIQLPYGAILEPGETYRIYIGKGLNASHSMYLGMGQSLFDNTGDVIYLRDANLNLRATQLWPANLTRGPEQSIVIDEVQFDAPGDDGINPNGEWIIVRNAGDVSVDLTDWRLKDDGFDYKFKSGESLAPGQQLKIYVGSGADSGSDRYWGNSSGIFDNLGQSLHIWTPRSLEVDTFAWGMTTSENEDPRGAIRMFANFDAVGSDTTNPNGEWVSLENTSNTAINIGGYKLQSGSDVYVFAAGTMLAANANMLVKVGSGTDSALIKYWGKSTGILANTSDYVDLIDTSAQTLLRHTWPAPYSVLSDNGLVIDAVNYDAPGNDATNPNGEWIRIRNSSLAEQNLRNWQIQVGSSQLNLLADRPIAAGETITVFIGTGTNTADSIYWGKSSGILSNTGSTIVKLLTPGREVVEQHGWGSAASSTKESVSAAIDMSINYDAVGEDGTNPNGEWVNLVNTSSSTVSLNGYHLYSDGTTYQFDSGDILKPGERMRVYRGAGTDSGLNRYSNLGLNDFANEGDEFELRSNATGGAVDIFSFPGSGLLPTRGQFEISGVNFNAPGDDATNPNGEWIDIKNTGTGTANLRDWRVQYQTATFFDFNSNMNVAAGATVRLFIGGGTNTTSTAYWGNAIGILGNLSGELQLQSNYRETVDKVTWPNTSPSATKYSIVIDDVQFDAPGDDSINPNGEWVKIRNAGDVTVNMTDWRLDEYRFKSGESLAPGQQMTIFVGSGLDSGSNRYWGNSTGILSNEGQQLMLWTPDFAQVDVFAWGTVTSTNEDPRGAIRMFANYDAAGSDATNPNGEWVSLQNTSDSAINIGGYKLKSGTDEYVFAAGTILAANSNMVVKVGSGTDTTTTKYWGNASDIFDNSIDYVDLINTANKTLLRHAWPLPYSGVTDYGLVIDSVNYDAPGDDATNPNGEWVRIRNASGAGQNLLNWQLLVGTLQLNFTKSLAIASGETVTVFVGAGTNTASKVYWGRSAGIMSENGAETVQLLAPNREVVERHGWGVAASSTAQSITAAIDMSINYDAAGDDATNPKGEWVNLVNTSSSTVSLAGYHLYTDGTTYVFDSADTLASGERMRVYRGTGTDSGLNRYSNLNEFANAGDEVELRTNVYGVIADVFSYPASGLLPAGGQFAITAINNDAVGDDATNPNGEWIDIKNTGTTTSDLRDWRIQYQTATFYDFNTSYQVAAGVTIRIYIGTGTNTSTARYWGNSTGILSNTTGSLVLQSNYRESASVFSW
jgi:endonuclease YncB( thermonuclease family)